MNGSSGGTPDETQTPDGHSKTELTATDGGPDCFYCGGTTDYHPTCDRPGCENQTHGSGPDGKLVKSYCHDCRPGDATLVTDGGLQLDLADVNVEAVAEERGLDEDGLRLHVDLYRRVQVAVNEDDVDLREVQAAVESLADDLQGPAEVPDEWILEERFGVTREDDIRPPTFVGRMVRWFR